MRERSSITSTWCYWVFANIADAAMGGLGFGTGMLILYLNICPFQKCDP